MLSLDFIVSRRRAITRLLAGASLLLTSRRLLQAKELKSGDPFPDLNQFGLAGAIPDLKGKVTLVDFWASWCAPCKKSFPVMKSVQEHFASRGFSVVAISLDENKSAMDGFLKKNPIPFIVLHDSKGRLADAAGLEKMPTSFLLDPQARIIAVHSGFEGEATHQAYLSEVEAALKAAGK